MQAHKNKSKYKRKTVLLHIISFVATFLLEFGFKSHFQWCRSLCEFLCTFLRGEEKYFSTRFLSVYSRLPRGSICLTKSEETTPMSSTSCLNPAAIRRVTKVPIFPAVILWFQDY